MHDRRHHEARERDQRAPCTAIFDCRRNITRCPPCSMLGSASAFFWKSNIFPLPQYPGMLFLLSLGTRALSRHLLFHSLPRLSSSSPLLTALMCSRCHAGDRCWHGLSRKCSVAQQRWNVPLGGHSKQPLSIEALNCGDIRQDQYELIRVTLQYDLEAFITVGFDVLRRQAHES